MLKVFGGTEKHGSSLCLTCRNATCVTNETSTMIVCSEVYSTTDPTLVSRMQPVVRCTGYDDKRGPSMSSMRQIAWNIMPDKGTGKVGFQPPSGKEHFPLVFNGKELY